MQILLYITAGWLLVRVLIATQNALDKPLIEALNAQVSDRKVSVLIPARNEEARIPDLMAGLKENESAIDEVILLDDDSTDETAVLAESYRQMLPQLRVVKGQPLPEGWLGKNWACHQLANQAKGDFLLFLDADVALKAGAIEKALSKSIEQKVALFTVFPRQQMKTFGEWAVVPLVSYILLTQLPLRWTRSKSNPLFAAANGQFMLFDAGAYHQNQWHRQVKASRAEDIDIAKAVKKAGYPAQTMLSRDLVRCRMYGGFRESLNGFSKNFPAFFLNNWFLGFAFSLVTGPAYLLLAFYYPVWALCLFAIEMAFLRGQVAALEGISAWRAILSGPVHMVTLFILAIFSAFQHLLKNQQWKGRNI